MSTSINLAQKFFSPQLLQWSDSVQLTPALNDVLLGIANGFYSPEKGQIVIFNILAKALKVADCKLPNFDDFKALIDEGDYLQVTGQLDYSQSGEPSVFVTEYKVLTKSLRPLAEPMEYSNTESRYLDRVSDYKMNTKDENGLSVRDIVRHKAKYWQIWREEMEKENFLEVECPVFEAIPGGAEARPFTTFYNELYQEMYLRISLELPLKKLIAGGFEKVFEIGRIFRNEGSSPQHLQEYTQIEWYCAYTNYDWAATFVKRVYQRVVEEILGIITQKAYNGSSINWGEWCSYSQAQSNKWELITSDKDKNAGWPKIAYFDAVRYFSNGAIDTENKSDIELLELCKINGINDVRIEDGTGTLLDKLWKKARINTTNPFFLVLPPVELEPLAKRDPSQPNLTQRWQVVAGGAELGKAFSELNDPIDQFGRFEKQQEARDAGNDEAQFMDMSYVRAMELGMPPMSGFGTSERFISFLLGKHIRECVTFPHIRTELNNSKDAKNSKIKYLQGQIAKYSEELNKLGVNLVQNNKSNNTYDPEAILELNPVSSKLNFEDLDFGTGTILDYWQNSYKIESTGTIIELSEDDKGKYAILDRTIFYPQGGGQPSDIGIFEISNELINVTKCVKVENQVYHYYYGYLEIGQEVILRVDKDKRIQNIQLHSTAHLIDCAISQLGFDWQADRGYSFPEGPYVQYIGEVEVNPELIVKIENKVNELRLQNLDFVQEFIQEQKEKHAGSEISRKIIIQDQNHYSVSECGCGGTHINNTSELSLITIRKIQSKKTLIKVSYSLN